MVASKRRNAIYIVVLSIVLIGLLAIAIIFFESSDKTIPLTLKITHNNVTETVKPWRDDTGKYYFFIPSYSSVDNTVLVASDSNCYLQGDLLTGEQTIGAFETDTEYRFEQHALFTDRDAVIVFLRSANVATMYIDTLNRNINYLNGDKKRKGKINVLLYGESGEVLYREDTYTGEISGRGNSTRHCEKKPYSIKLSAPAKLLDMAEAQNWVLLANAYDETNLRNKLIYDLAGKVDMGWAPHCEYVDLYLNGEYRGLYLLSEKVEVDSNRVTLNDPGNDYLFEAIFSSRAQDNNHVFNVGSKYFTVNYPKECDENKLAEVEKNIAQLDAEIKAGNLDRIDLNSWVKRFLVDEIFINQDAITVSSFYHYDTGSGKFYAGPIWDYDLSFGNDTSLASIKTKNLSRIYGLKLYWYSQLYRNETFYQEIKQVYQEEFLPKLEKLLSDDLPNTVNRIHAASVCNSTRWKQMFKSFYSGSKEIDTRIQDLSTFLTTRLSYLEPIWCSDKKFEIVTWYAADKTTLLDVTLVEYGTRISEFPTVNGKANDDWNMIDSDCAFDATQPVTESCFLYFNVAEPVKKEDTITPLDQEKSLILLAVLCAALAFIGAILIYSDIKHNRRR